MRNGMARRARAAICAVGVAVSTAACAGTPLGDVLGGVLSPQSGTNDGEIGGEIRQVDTRGQQLQLRLQDGRVATVLYDNRTQVVYQQQQYPVTALEPGDYVIVRLQQTSGGQAYTDYIYVQQSVQERTGQTGGGYGAQRVDGYVGGIDYQRGQFELRLQNQTIVVTLPYNPGSTTVDRFRRLRQGEYVRIEGRLVSQGRFELDRFV